MIAKNNTKGNNIKNHETIGAPASHIKFKTQVQNKIYKNLIINTKRVLGTSHE
jgi:hypothetical protein